MVQFSMDHFCISPFWDDSLTWNTTVPIFTHCFLKTALIWTPIVFFWLFISVEAVFIIRSKEQKLPWSLLILAKMIIAAIIMMTSLAEIIVYMLQYSKGEDVHPVQYYTPFLVFITMVAMLIVILFQRRKGIATSGILFLFWLLFMLASGASYYTMMQKTFNSYFDYDETMTGFESATSVLYFALSFAELLLFSFSDLRIKEALDPKECPEVRASFLSKVTFWWFNPMAVLGYKQPLSMGDMWDLLSEHLTANLLTRFNKHWLPRINKCMNEFRKVKAQISRRYSSPAHHPSAVTLKADELENATKPEESDHLQGDLPQVKVEPDACELEVAKLSVLVPIMKTFWFDMLLTGFLKFVASIITFVNPLILDAVIAFISSDEPYWKGFAYALGMFFSSMIESFFNSQYEFRIYNIAMQIRSCLTSIVHKKALVLSVSAKKNYTTGEIVNLMSVDIQRVMDYVQVVNLLWSAPLQIGIAIYLLWGQLGLATMGGLAIMILMIPFNAVVSIYIRNSQFGLMKEKDKRTKLMNEILGGIKVLKLYAWEPSFQAKVHNVRSKEIENLTFQAYLSGAITFAFTSAPFLIALASFATYVLMDPMNVLDANKAFVSLSLFNILRIPTALLPMIITYSAMFLVSLRRINKYLQSQELDPNVVTHDNDENPVSIENGIFSWSKEESPVLTDVNFKAEDGSLVAVVGQVGSGKSSLLSALLGEMEKWSGRVNVKGSVAYVPQQAWIQNATLKKNIVFVKPQDERKYNAVIEACALRPDLDILPGGDKTEIGEKGINLSGGQKQRVSLARAVYDDADVYLLDDPLSAVDAHVGKHIFEKVIGPTGMLKRKTRILVTHRISVLPDVDTIYVLKDGKITENGSYKELLAKNGAFAEFLIQYLQETASDLKEVSEEELRLMEQIADTVNAPKELKTQLSVRAEVISDGEPETATPHRTLSIVAPSPSQRGDMVRRRVSSVSGKESSTKLNRESVSAVGTKLIDKETVEVGSVKMAVYIEYIKAFGYSLCFWTFLGFAASSGFSLGTNLWLSIWSNDSLDPSTRQDVPLRNLRLGVYGALGAGEVAFTLISSITLNLACLKASNLIHNGMLDRILRAPMSFFDTTPLGRILNRFSKDVDTADVTIRFNMRMMFIQTFRAISCFIIISLETPIFLIAILPLGILYYLMQKCYIPTSRQLKRLESTSRSPIYIHFSETVTGASCIRAYGAEKQFIDRSSYLVDTNNTSYYPSLAASRWLAIRLEFIGYCIVFAAALCAVLLRDTLSPGVAGLSISYALQITGVLNMLVRATADVETNIVSIERCLEYTKTPIEADWYDEKKKPDKSWPSDGVVVFENYSTRYREGLDLVLTKISCHISAGERIGIVGRTGAGKSSLTLAVFRIIEAAFGKISVDGINIAEMGLHDLRSKLTIIPQDPVLFTGTLRMNLDPFDVHKDEDIWTSLELAHLKSFVTTLEKGLQHDVSEGGENLSVGQRQLVCLARALLRKTKVLILDEATAAVDVETDEVIQNTIRTAFKDCTVMTIAHRLNTVVDYDRVMVLSKGEIAELDTPENLLKDVNSIFYSMAKDAGLI